MLRLLCLLAFASLLHAEDELAHISWPKPVCDFPKGDNVTFTSNGYVVKFRIPDDPDLQSTGGSGGPIVEITLNDSKSSWKTTFTEQSVGERLLENFKGRPQIEIWGRGGGGYWSRGLYRYISGEYRCVRIDDFEEQPRHNNQNAPTTEMPDARQGKGDQQEDKLHFIETRLPDTK